MKKICKSCGKIYSTPFCGYCGEKSLNASDFSLKKITGEAFEAFTNFDSRFFRTFGLLFFTPWRLSRAYIEGKRVPYMKPFQIFLIANLIFFIFLSDFDLFRTPSQWLFNDSFKGFSFAEKVREIMLANNESYESVARRYDRLSSDLSKAFLIFMTPVLAGMFMLFSFKFKTRFTKHFIVGIHFLSLLLLIFTFIYGIFRIADYNGRVVFISLILLTIHSYLFFIFKNFYKTPWWLAILQTLMGGLSVYWIFQLYKWAINFISIHFI